MTLSCCGSEISVVRQDTGLKPSEGQLTVKTVVEVSTRGLQRLSSLQAGAGEAAYADAEALQNMLFFDHSIEARPSPALARPTSPPWILE